MRHCYLLSLFLLLSLIAKAQTISEDEAMQKAQQFFSSSHKAKRSIATDGSVRLAYTSASGYKTRYYVFNNTGGGFVIVGGDNVACEILGYSDTGNFDYEQIPDNFKWWLSQYDEQIDSAIVRQRSGEAQIAKRKKAPTVAAASIEPLLGTGADAIKWNQGEPYNLAIDGGKGNFWAGCTCAAGAQIMKYYEYPSQDTGIRYDALLLGKINGEDVYAPAITDDYTYDWSSMKRQYSGIQYSLSDPDVTDLANLYYRLSRSANANYGTSGTGISLRDMGKTMIEHFSFDKSMLYLLREYYTDEQWENTIYNELVSERPVIYEGRNSKDGHAFICDGYDAANDTYHINWGWGGLLDGYFVINGSDALNSEYYDPFSERHGILMNIMPDHGSDYPYFISTAGYTIERNEVTRDQRLIIQGYFENNTYGTFNGKYGVMFLNIEDENDYVIEARGTINIPPFYRLSSISVNVPDSFKEGNRYYVMPVYEDRDGEWQRIVMHSDCEIPVITIVPPDPAAFSTTGYDIKENNIPPGKNTGITGEFKNLSNGTFKGKYGVMFVNVEDDSDKEIAFASNYWGIDPYESFTNIYFSAPQSLKELGHYYVIPVFEDENGNIRIFQLPEDFEIPIIDIRAFDRSINGGCDQWTIPANEFSLGSSFYANGLYYNEGEVPADIIFGFKFTNINDSTDIACVSSYMDHLFPGNCFVRPITVVVPTTLTVGETYKLTSVYIDENNEWQECIKRSNFDDPIILITPPAELVLTEGPVFKNNGYITKEDDNIVFKIKNFSNETVKRGIRVWVDLGSSIYSYDTYQPYEEKTFEFSDYLQYKENGIHKVLITDNNTPHDFFITFITLTDELPITYNMPSDKWGTICLPYEADVPEGLTAYTVTGINGDVVEKEEVSKLEMNKPYLLNGDEGTYTFKGPDTPTGTYQNGLLYGVTNVPQEGTSNNVPSNSYVLQKQGTIGFCRIDEGTEQSIQPYTAYLQVPEELQSTKMFYLDDIATGIRTIKEKPNESKAYNVQGMRVNRNTKGLVIVDGRLKYNK